MGKQEGKRVINVLAPDVVSKIAAGEVVERPFSVLKELVENAIDAGATRIQVELEEGGKKLLRVRDDGRGMTPGDLELAFVQHATSKLTDVDELDAIVSLGFRGEALASIGSVSRARIVSRARGAQSGHEIRCIGGRVEEVKPAAAAEGTIVEVRDLFYNVPARRRFLKSDSAERSRCLEVLTRLALAHPDCGFEFSGGKRTLRLEPGEGLRDRVAKLFGRELAGQGLAVEFERGGIRVEGLAIDPDGARRDRSQQQLFVNGRPIKDRSLSHAIDDAYREYLMGGKHAVVFLFLVMDPSRVDVNVHPTKSEVRFVEGRMVYSAVRGGLLAALGRRCERLSDASLEAVADPSGAFGSARPTTAGQRASVQRGGSSSGAASSGATSEAPQPKTGFPELPKGLFGDPEGVGSSFARGPSDRVGGRVAESAASGKTSSQTAPDPQGETSSDAAPASRGEDALGEFLLGQGARAPRFGAARRFLVVDDLYIVFETDDGVAIVDQHALHERVIYERLLAASREGGIAIQRLLVPAVVELAPADKELIVDQSEALEKAGIVVSDFGGSAVKLEGYPAALRRVDPRAFVEGLVAELREGEVPTEPEELLERFHSRACRSAIMAGDRLSEDEIAELLAAAAELEHPHNCPHGRPTTINFSRVQLERFFKRKL